MNSGEHFNKNKLSDGPYPKDYFGNKKFVLVKEDSETKLEPVLEEKMNSSHKSLIKLTASQLKNYEEVKVQEDSSDAESYINNEDSDEVFQNVD